MPVDNTEVRAVRVGSVARDHVLLLMVAGLIGLVLGWVATQRGTESQSASTPILVNPLDGNPFYPSARGEQLINLETEAQALRSNRVAQMVANRTDTDLTIPQLLSNVRVAVPPNTQILEVTYAGSTRDTAIEYSQAFAEAYLDYRRQQARSVIEAETDRLDESIAEREEEFETLADDFAATPSDSPQASVLQFRMTALANQVSTLATRRTELTSTPVDPGQIVNPAEIDASGPLRTELLLPLAGLMLGLLGGLSLAVLRTRSDHRIHDDDDVRVLGVPVLGSVRWSGTPTATADDSGAPDTSDDYRRIRVSIMAVEPRRPFSLLVAGASNEMHSPRTVTHLALSFTRAGLDTIIVDATTSEDGPGVGLTEDGQIGLTEVLLDGASLEAALVPVGPNLWILPSGRDVASAADSFVGANISDLLSQLKELFGVVIVAATTIQHGDGQSLASVTDAVVLEAGLGSTTRSEVRAALNTMQLLPSTLLGCITTSTIEPPRRHRSPIRRSSRHLGTPAPATRHEMADDGHDVNLDPAASDEDRAGVPRRDSASARESRRRPRRSAEPTRSKR